MEAFITILTVFVLAIFVGCEIITNFPSDHLISCGLPGCEIY